jgi:hypothetical protein
MHVALQAEPTFLPPSSDARAVEILQGLRFSGIEVAQGVKSE